jgi:hypothetical protein
MHIVLVKEVCDGELLIVRLLTVVYACSGETSSTDEALPHPPRLRP